MTKYLYLALLISGFCPGVNADHKPEADWSWHVLSGGISESRMSIHRRDQLFGIFNFSCDLTDASEEDSNESNASLKLVQLDSRPDGLLLITCNVGAHSQQVNIIDLASTSNIPVFSKTGSYIADWEIQDGELWIRYDQPCATGISVECPDGFETIFVQYPSP
jgi:hypothetical protein